MKWGFYGILMIVLAGVWFMYSRVGGEMKSIKAEIEQIENAGSGSDHLAELKTKLQGHEGQRTLNGILLTFVSAGFVGILFVLEILPAMAHRVTHSIYDSAEMVERDVMSDGRSLILQGEYEEAILAFRLAAEQEPGNRMPWMEIARIYKDYLKQSAAAIQTLRDALEGQPWEPDDAAYFLFRLAEFYDELEGDRASAVVLMNQVVEQFPGTRHSANANHKLLEWKAAENAAIAAAEEREYLEQMEAARLAAVADADPVVADSDATLANETASLELQIGAKEGGENTNA